MNVLFAVGRTRNVAGACTFERYPGQYELPSSVRMPIPRWTEKFWTGKGAASLLGVGALVARRLAEELGVTTSTGCAATLVISGNRRIPVTRARKAHACARDRAWSGCMTPPLR